MGTSDNHQNYDEQEGKPLPKFGEWDVNDPASAEGFTVIFNKARDEKKTGGGGAASGRMSSRRFDSKSKRKQDPQKPSGPFVSFWALYLFVEQFT
ncbi:Protein noi4 [Stylosanthes scabra]|uniref:Protein noi4 n=1 Tax=Stylosanthes scabra TaxID=79078 RepID=A0ABU6ZES7_9FABA|nr:Protein noi4 [Stylosanthes scabra]